MIWDLGIRIWDLKKGFVRFALLFAVLYLPAFAQQETPPVPGPPKSASIPKPVEKTLPNGLRVILVQTKNVPLVTARLLVKSGGEADPKNLSGLADFTASLLTKGTKTRSATKIAEEIEFLGGSIEAAAGWDVSNIAVRVTADKVDKALAVMSDVALNPAFAQEEIDRYREQLIDDLSVRMKQPGNLAGYVASKIVFNSLGSLSEQYGHPLSGTPESVKRITRNDLNDFHQTNFAASNAVLVFTGDITPAQAFLLANKWFAKMKPRADVVSTGGSGIGSSKGLGTSGKVNGIYVVDLPNAGQAAVYYAQIGPNRSDKDYFKASVFNSILGGGYSSRLNQEIRIKRGLSYGARSGFGMRRSVGIFNMTTQTKNESAAEVADLFVTELNRMADGELSESEFTPRKSVLTGNFGRNLATTGGLAQIVGELAVYGLSLNAINSYVQNINAVSAGDVKSFANSRLRSMMGVLVIVGDYKIFSGDLKKRFPNEKVQIIEAGKLNLESNTLQ